MRSGTGTKSGEPGVVTFPTKATIACLVLPWFQDGSGSVACAAATTMLAKKNAIAMTLGRYVLLTVGPPAGVRP
jgi:hypothetical protein